MRAYTYPITYLTFGGCLGIVLTPDSNTRTSCVGGVLQGGAPTPTGGGAHLLPKVSETEGLGETPPKKYNRNAHKYKSFTGSTHVQQGYIQQTSQLSW